MFEKLTYAALIRIAAWTIFFLLILSAALPQVPPQLRYQDEMLAQGIYPVLTDENDPRWSRTDILPNMANKTNIVWVAGSSVLIPPREFPEEGEEEIYDHLPARVQEVLKEEHGKDTSAQLSLLLARRNLDTYTMTLDALARDPDMLVVTINPFWDFNEQSVYFKQNIFNAAPPLWAANGDLNLVLLQSPSNLLWNLAVKYIPALRDSYDRMALLQDRFEQSGFEFELDKNKKDPNLFADIKYDQPLIFWIVHRVLGGDTESIERDPGKFNAKMWQLLTLQSMRMDKERGWADHSMRKMLQTIKDSGTPALIYLAPLSEYITYQDAAYDSYSKVYARMGELKKQYETDNLKIITTLPQEVGFSLSHVDFLHLDMPGRLPDYLAGEIAAMMEAEQ